MIIVTSLKDHLSVCESIKANHLISVIDPGFIPNTPKNVSEHLKLGFDDIIKIKSTNLIHRKDNIIEQNENIKQILPNEQHVIKIINFISNWDKSKPIVIHCWCGVSRSMAVATFIFCMLNRNNIDSNIKYLRYIAPHANPNKLMISIFEKFLNVKGKINKSLEKYPHTVTYDCQNTFAPVSIFNINELKNFR